jgi:hypothetical protein
MIHELRVSIPDSRLTISLSGIILVGGVGLETGPSGRMLTLFGVPQQTF